MDCCRGELSLESNNNHNNNSSKNMGFSVSKLKGVDEYHWFSTINQYVAFTDDNNGGTYFGNALVTSFIENLKNNNNYTLQGKISGRVQEIVSQHSKQLPERVSYLRHPRIYFGKRKSN